MSAVREGRRGRNRPVAVVVVVAIDIIDIAVSVVVYPVARNLTLVHPHIRGKVFMVRLHALINHGHNHVRITGLKGPGSPDIGIRPRETLPSEDRAWVVVMPLLLLHVGALVEREGVLPRHLSLRWSNLLWNSGEGSETVLIGHSDLHRILDALDRAAAPELTNHGRCLYRFVETCHIPAVQSLGLCPGLELAAFRE